MHSSRTPEGQSNSTPTLLETLVPVLKAAILETLGLHWLDTLAKRVQTFKGSLFADTNTIGQIKKGLLRDAAGKGFLATIGSLYSGFGVGTLYKLGQRTLKFAGQKPTQTWIKKHVTSIEWLSHALAGAWMGFAEAVIFTCLDALKIKFQTDEIFKMRVANAYRTGGFFGFTSELLAVIREEKLYKKGLGATISRNVPGSFALFGTPAIIKSCIYTNETLRGYFGWTDELTAVQLMLANYGGSAASIILPAPVDLIKTRQQAMSTSISTFELARNVFREEGMRAFFKGVPIKLATLGFKQAAFMTMLDYFARGGTLVNIPRLPSEAWTYSSALSQDDWSAPPVVEEIPTSNRSVMSNFGRTSSTLFRSTDGTPKATSDVNDTRLQVSKKNR